MSMINNIKEPLNNTRDKFIKSHYSKKYSLIEGVEIERNPPDAKILITFKSRCEVDNIDILLFLIDENGFVSDITNKINLSKSSKGKKCGSLTIRFHLQNSVSHAESFFMLLNRPRNSYYSRVFKLKTSEESHDHPKHIQKKNLDFFVDDKEKDEVELFSTSSSESQRPTKIQKREKELEVSNIGIKRAFMTYMALHDEYSYTKNITHAINTQFTPSIEEYNTLVRERIKQSEDLIKHINYMIKYHRVTDDLVEKNIETMEKIQESCECLDRLLEEGHLLKKMLLFDSEDTITNINPDDWRIKIIMSKVK